MKILTSSNQIAIALSNIDFDIESVQSVYLEGNQFFIETNKGRDSTFVEVIEREEKVIQVDRPWEHVRELLTKAQEQPIVLQIGEKCVSVIFQY